MSINVVTEWPQAAALAMFSSERQQQIDETLGVFQRIETIVAR
jgi:hypothetical protein